MLAKLCFLIHFSVILTSVKTVVAEISLDYYFGELRSDIPIADCSSDLMRETCNAKCGPRHACLLGKCFCLLKKEEMTESDSGTDNTDDGSIFIDFEDYSEVTPTATMHPLMANGQFEQKPALRHNIAHFCPDLEIARECIRKCRTLGKPAFCGKDHVCYCGHRYDYPISKAKNMDPNDVYAQFKDLYLKYFGPKGQSSLTSTTANKTSETTKAPKRQFLRGF